MMTDAPEGDDLKALRNLIWLIVIIAGVALLAWKVMHLMEARRVVSELSYLLVEGALLPYV